MVIKEVMVVVKEIQITALIASKTITLITSKLSCVNIVISGSNAGPGMFTERPKVSSN
jgi:hypothetical protein